MVVFFDRRYRELERHEVLKFKAEEIADLIRSRGFKEHKIDKDHPDFKSREQLLSQHKEQLTEEERLEL